MLARRSLLLAAATLALPVSARASVLDGSAFGLKPGAAEDQTRALQRAV